MVNVQCRLPTEKSMERTAILYEIFKQIEEHKMWTNSYNDNYVMLKYSMYF